MTVEQMPTIWGLSKRAANYGPASNERAQCRNCAFMFPPLALGSCRYVRGIIAGDHTCDEFKPRRPSDVRGTSA